MGIFELPEGYREIRRINMQTDKKLAIWLNVGSIIIFAAVMFVGAIFTPGPFEFLVDDLRTLLPIILLVPAMILYIIGHELVHGIFIKKFTGRKAKFGFTGLYAFAGSDAFIHRPQYIVIALAPVLGFGVLFLLLNIFLPANLFWYVLFLQGLNISGAVGDFYIIWLVSRLPADILTKDEGFTMLIYSAAE